MLFVLLLIIVLILLIRNIRIVSQGYCYVIERLGVYHTTWNAGIHIKIPFIDKVVRKISLKEQVLDFPPQSVITKDNVTMTVDSVVYVKVFDPKLYTYGVENPKLGLQNIAATTLRSVIGNMNLDDTLAKRSEINASMEVTLDQATDAWGMKVIRVELKEVKPPRDIEESMTEQMRAERQRRATLLEAQAHEESVVSIARGDKQSKILAAEAERDAQIALAKGRAEAIRLTYEAEADGIRKLQEAGISQEVLKLKSLEALKDVADGQATKVFIPTDLTDVLMTGSLFGETSGLAKDPVKGTPRKQVARNEILSAANEAVQEDLQRHDNVNPLTKKSLQHASVAEAHSEYPRTSKNVK